MRALESVLASLEIEGLTPSDFAVELAKKDIPIEERIKLILEYYGVSACEKYHQDI